MTLWSRFRTWIASLVPSDEQRDAMPDNHALIRDRMADLAERRRRNAEEALRGASLRSAQLNSGTDR